MPNKKPKPTTAWASFVPVGYTERCDSHCPVLTVIEFRVTKYDPAFRDARGSYLRDDWITFDQIGESFSGVTLTEQEYLRVEGAYSEAAIAFMREAGIRHLNVVGLENHRNAALTFGESSVIGDVEFASVLPRLLRAEFWCRLESAEGFLHFGYDYYMYIGVPRPCPEAAKLAARLGLFVEPMPSPYRECRD